VGVPNEQTNFLISFWGLCDGVVVW